MNNDFLRLPVLYQDYLSDYFRLISEFYKDRLISVAIFGSVARGREKPSSDIDVLLVIENLPNSLDERMAPLTEIYLSLREKDTYKKLTQSNRSGLITEFPFTPAEIKDHPPILLDIIDDGIIIFDRESFSQNEFCELKKRLAELGARKIHLNTDSWYWILKPDIKFGEIVKI